MARRNILYPAPIVPVGKGQLIRFLQDELTRISDTINAIATGHLTATHNVPAKPVDGDYRYADGTNWDPGDGEGLYIYFGGTWHSAVYKAAAAQLSSTVNHIPTDTNPLLITLNTEDYLENITHSAGLITIQTPGIYHISHSIQVGKTSGSSALFADYWLNLNGTALANTNVRSSITNSTDTQTAAVTYVKRFAAGDILRRYLQVSSTSGSPGLYATAASGSRPVTPSVMLSIVKVG